MAAARAVEDAVEELGQAHAKWNGMESEIATLLRLAGHDTRDVPRFPEQLAVLVKDARRAGGVQVPAPLPGQRVYATVAAHDDPNPEIPEAARAKIAREATT